MKKIFLFLAVASLAVSSCRKDDSTSTDEVSIETQNTYDDTAIQKFLNDNYIDSRGNIKTFSDTDTSDDAYVKLSAMNPVKLASGVVYIKFEGAQPTNGKTINTTDKISLMHITNTYVAIKGSDGVVKFGSSYNFRDRITGASTTPEKDPAYYYVKTSALNKYNTDHSTTYTRSFFEMEGFQEALKNFQSFEMPDSDNYHLQGIIIVPSRAAFARDNYYPYSGFSFRNRCFVFNFQVYNSETRLTTED